MVVCSQRRAEEAGTHQGEYGGDVLPERGGGRRQDLYGLHQTGRRRCSALCDGAMSG